LLHLLQVVELAVPEAGRAVRLVAVHAEVAVLVPGHHRLASEALAGGGLLVLLDHALRVLVTTRSVLLYALGLDAESEALLLAAV